MSDTANSTVGQALGVESYPLEHAGRLYACSLLTQEGKAKFEGVLVSRALRMLATMRGVYSPEEYEDERALLLDEIKTGVFGFHGPLAAEAMQSPSGVLSLAAILFGISESDAIRLMVERRDDVRTCLDASLAASLPARRDDGGEKKVKGPKPRFTSRRS